MIFSKDFGVGTALITPFRQDGSIDFGSLSSHVEYQIANGIDYLVALGTTSEVVTLSQEERTAVVNLALEVSAGRVPVVVGVGGNNTSEIVRNIQNIPNEVWGILSVTPYYNKPSQDGLYQHFKQIALATDKPIILYNVPPRTSVNMLPETTLALANDFKNIVAVKEASGLMTQIMEIIRLKPEGFQVISGDDAIALPLIAAGANGVISVIGNAYPKALSSMVHLLLKGEIEQAKKIHYALLPIISGIFEEGSPAGIKQALHYMNLGDTTFRLPLTAVSEKTADKIKALVENAKDLL